MPTASLQMNSGLDSSTETDLEGRAEIHPVLLSQDSEHLKQTATLFIWYAGLLHLKHQESISVSRNVWTHLLEYKIALEKH